MAAFILSIDQGTTSTRAMVFDASLKVVGVSQQEFPQIYPRSGWVEHEPGGPMAHGCRDVAGGAGRG
jgi:glycerol kinase